MAGLPIPNMKHDGASYNTVLAQTNVGYLALKENVIYMSI